MKTQNSMQAITWPNNLKLRNQKLVCICSHEKADQNYENAKQYAFAHMTKQPKIMKLKISMLVITWQNSLKS